MARNPDFMLCLREALAASWDKRTAYLEVEQAGNPALGQCYPTSRVVQHYYPETEIIKGKVWTGKRQTFTSGTGFVSATTGTTLI
jgi:hypothetical protein